MKQVFAIYDVMHVTKSMLKLEQKINTGYNELPIPWTRKRLTTYVAENQTYHL